jgi:DNA-binding SARP family transcriptional activator
MFSDSADASLNLAGVKRQPDSGPPGRTQLRLRGAPGCVLPDGRVLELETKDALLLAFLAVEGQTARATIAGRLWPDVDAERARGNLRARLLRMRQRVGAELVSPGALAMLAEDVTHDLDEGSEVLAPVALDGAGGFADWLENTRLARKARRAERLAAASEHAEKSGQLAVALEHAQALVALDGLSEHAHRRLMRLHYLRGDAAAARATYQRCVEVLRREHGAVARDGRPATANRIVGTARIGTHAAAYHRAASAATGRAREGERRHRRRVARRPASARNRRSGNGQVAPARRVHGWIDGLGGCAPR